MSWRWAWGAVCFTGRRTSHFADPPPATLQSASTPLLTQRGAVYNPKIVDSSAVVSDSPPATSVRKVKKFCTSVGKLSITFNVNPGICVSAASAFSMAF
jgi:hypothetical protein